MVSDSISICIPTYEMRNKGDLFLEQSFEKLKSQTYKNFNVIISDHSESNIIENVCDKWKKHLDIRYYKNTNKRGNSSANLNNCIRFADNDIVKILFQDDFLFNDESLYNQIEQFVKSKTHWLVTSSYHTVDCVNFYRPYCPVYNDKIQYGANTISSPSVVMFKNKDVLEFDENLIWLMDCDFYKRMYDKFGLPSICNHITVVNRNHDDQITSSIIDETVKSKEQMYIINKYGKK